MINAQCVSIINFFICGGALLVLDELWEFGTAEVKARNMHGKY